MNGPKSSKRAKRGRPKKKPDYNREIEMSRLLTKAVELFGAPYDDRDDRDENEPTIVSVAEALGTSETRVRKLLITANYYSTQKSRWIQELAARGYTTAQIMKETGLGITSVNGYLPYKKGIYLLEEPTLYAEQTRLFRKRKRVCEELKKHLTDPDAERYLWEAVKAFENYPFKYENGKSFRYQMEGEGIRCLDHYISRDELEQAFQRARTQENQIEGTMDLLDLPYGKELDMIFLRIGAYRNR